MQRLSNKRRRFIYWLTTASLLLVLSTPVSAQELPFTHYNTDSYVNPLPSAAIRAIYQDQQGFMWIGVFSSALIRYDGQAMHQFTTTDGLPGLEIIDITQDSQGYLWVGTRAGIAVSAKPLQSYLRDEDISFIVTLAGIDLYSGKIIQNSMMTTADGNVWVPAQDQGLWRYRQPKEGHAKFDAVMIDVGLGDTERIQAVTGDATDEIIVAIGSDQTKSRLVRISTQDSHITPIPVTTPQNFSKIKVMYGSFGKSLWIGNDAGQLWRLQAGSTDLQTIKLDTDKNITTLLQPTGQNLLWVGTNGSGAFLIDPANNLPSPALYPQIGRNY